MHHNWSTVYHADMLEHGVSRLSSWHQHLAWPRFTAWQRCEIMAGAYFWFKKCDKGQVSFLLKPPLRTVPPCTVSGVRSRLLNLSSFYRQNTGSNWTIAHCESKKSPKSEKRADDKWKLSKKKRKKESPWKIIIKIRLQVVDAIPTAGNYY